MGSSVRPYRFNVRFQLAVVWVIRKLALARVGLDRRVITRQSSTGIRFLDDYRQRNGGTRSGIGEKGAFEEYRGATGRKERKKERKMQ